MAKERKISSQQKNGPKSAATDSSPQHYATASINLNQKEDPCKGRLPTTVKGWAKLYLAMGMSAIAVIAGTKQPKCSWKKFQEQPPTLEELEEMFGATECNVGVITGKVSGIVVVDLDTAEAVQYAKDQGFFDNTPRVATSKGYHLYFRYKAGLRNFQGRADLPGIDLRGDGGYVVAPPSIHESGHQYQWKMGKAPWDIPFAEFPESILAKTKDEKKPIEVLLQGVGKGERNNSLVRILGHLSAGGLNFETCMAEARKWNTKNSPPLSDDEVKRTVESIYNLNQNSKKSSRPNRDTFVRYLRETIVLPDFLLFHDDLEQAWVRCQINGTFVVKPLYSGDSEYLIRKLVWDGFGVSISSANVKELQDFLRTIAHFEGPMHRLHYRSAWHDGCLWIDLGSADWSAIKVSMSGYEVVPSKDVPPVFKRFSHMQALPLPVKGGSLEMLRPFVRVPTKAAWNLLSVWAVAALLPHIPRPGLILHGLQGSGKSSTSKLIRSLIDPSLTALLTLPGSEKEMVQLFDHHFLLVLDNLQKMKQWASDSLCRAVSGGASSKRKLYSDADDVIFRFIRPFILNGINIPGTSPDLLDRAIILPLGRIDPSDRQAEQGLVDRFEKARPYIFGAMLDALSASMKTVVNVQLDTLPRMADFARWGFVIAEHLEIGGEVFLRQYQRNASLQHVEVISSDPVAHSVLSLAKAVGIFEGTATELHQRCKEYLEEDELKDKSWPKAIHTFSKRLRRVVHNLYEMGVEVEFTRKSERVIKINYVIKK